MDVVLYDNPQHPVRATGSALGDSTNGDYTIVRVPAGLNASSWWVSMEVVNTDGSGTIAGFASSGGAETISSFGEVSIYPATTESAPNLNGTRYLVPIPTYSGANNTTNAVGSVAAIPPGGSQRRLIIPTTEVVLGGFMSFRTSLRSVAAAFNARVRIVLHANSNTEVFAGSGVISRPQQA
jgi:hypothetical protein